MQRRNTERDRDRERTDRPLPGIATVTPVRPDIIEGRSSTRAPHVHDATLPAERGDIARSLTDIANSLDGVDDRAAERMRTLARAITTDDGRQRWSEVDLRRAFNTERLAYALALKHEGSYAHSRIATADRIRNVLVLAPILLTWFALAEASRAYAAYIELNPDEVRQPFLLLWERGFGGQASPFAPSFSVVALIDAVVIAVIIALTFYAHGRREAREGKVDLTAERFQADIDNALAEASVALAVDRGSRPALLARNVERLVDRFDQNSQELLTRLRVEHDRLEQLASRREREFADFGVFASGMRAGAEETHRLLVELRQVSAGLQTALEDLTSEVSQSVDQGRTLLRAVQGLEQITVSSMQSDQTLTRQLATAATALTEAADKGMAGADAAAQASRIATEAVKGIGAIAHDLVASQTRMERAVSEEAEANSKLSDAMRTSAGGFAASTRTLGEIDSSLVSLKDDLGRMAAGTSSQAQTLSNLLEQQATVATGLAQVARDISTISVRTAQRQDDLTRDVGEMIERLDRVMRGMGVAAAPAAVDDARPDPERLWPRRRS